MTNDDVLAVCRSNWEYRGLDEASVRELLEELSKDLADAEATGRTPQDVVGQDITAFATSWARARRPLPYRLLRMAATVSYVLGVALLFGHLLRWSTVLPVLPSRIGFYAAVAAVTVAWELRRGRLGIRKGWVLAFVVGLPVLVITNRLAGDEPLFDLPLWGTLVLLLPGLPYAVVDARAKQAQKAARKTARTVT
ncbi:MULTISPECIES: hypothetical protein [unclassified Streptomyces]|uniref:hypothetical protein n=1 Tax=unclassified Streptomyces TaxID=2593676 RepID=UPI002DD7B3D6|nr:hypothetical protein [Streptomyces sp. NBC_01750]WSB04659.1 hypothetical protein OIE54_38730 [Streptomyces sp. NBC_01794]WSD31059.1 hypothetical protein OG966_03390 [Streptomyces sp. NBC_01750]